MQDAPKTVRLTRLTLSHFQGVRDYTLRLDGRSATIRGTNAVGKTTLATAFSWLVTGKDKTGATDFAIKTLENGQPLHNLEHSVEADLTVNDQPVTLKRVYAEVWTKRRGSARPEFTGHETRYFVDGVPMAKKDYDQRVQELLVPDSLWRDLTDPDAWHSRHWKERRADLIDLAGDVTDEQVIESAPELADLPAILGKRSPDDHRAIVTGQRKRANEELRQLPARIDEVRRSIAALPQPEEDIAGRLATAREALDEERQRIADLQASDPAAQHRQQRREQQARLEELREKARRDHERRTYDLRIASERAQQDVSDLRDRLALLQRTLESKTEEAASHAANAQRLREEWQRVNAEPLPEPTTDDTCPACHQPLPPQRVEAALQAALEEARDRKANALSRIVEQGKREKVLHTASEAEANNLRTRIATLTDSIAKREAEADEARAAFDLAESQAWDVLPEDADEAEELRTSLMAAPPSTPDIDLSTLRELEATVDALAATAAQQGTLFSATERIAELERQEEEHAATIERIDRELYLLDAFTRAKSDMLTERINGHFAITRFRLFEEQVNGGVVDVCVAEVGGVPYGSGLNRAGRINSGLDVIATLQWHHGVALPVFVDESESVVSLLDVPTQVVNLVVDEAFASMKVTLWEQEAA